MPPEPHRLPAPSHLNTATDVGVVWRINQALWADPRTKDQRIQINSAEGRIRLHGEVSTAESRLVAVEIVRAIPGVKVVLNEIIVGHDHLAPKEHH